MKIFVKNKKFLVSASVLMMVLIIFAAFLLINAANKVKDSVIIEAGEDLPNASLFFRNAGNKCDYITDKSSIDNKKLGKIKIELESDGKKFTSFLIIQDTIPPAAKPVEQYIFKSSELDAEDFVTDIEDATKVICNFASLPDLNKTGWQNITITLTDEGKNSINIESKVYIFDIEEELVIEAGSIKSISAEDFIKNYIVTDNMSLDIDVVSSNFSSFSNLGIFHVNLKSGKYAEQTFLKIVDTTPPTGKPVEGYILGDNSLKIEAADFVSDIQDVTQVICSFAAPLDLNKAGWQDITVILTDEGGNTANINSRVFVFDVMKELNVEAGSIKSLHAEDFISNYDEIDVDTKNLYLTEISADKFSILGSFKADIKLDKYITAVTVTVTDTIPPAGKPVEQYIFKNNDVDEIKADDFVTDIEDVTKVTCSFAELPDLNKIGWQDITIMLVDEGKNKTEINSKLYIFDVVSELTVEASWTSSVSAKNFIKNYIDNKNLSIISDGSIKYNIPGSYPVTLKCGTHTVKSVIKIVDTTPPVASVKNCWTYKNKQIEASKFVYNITDISSVTVKYKNKPDFSLQGVQTIYVILEDAYKNMSEYKAELTIVVDTTPPVISGVTNKWVVVGGTIAYKTGITVTDDYDVNVSLSLAVDSSDVNLNKAGTYTVIYSAVDESGNRAEAKSIITVRPVDMTLVNEMADNILSNLINSNMTQYDKAKAIFYWIHRKMKYSANKNPREIAQRAYDCFTKGTGDCYTYMAASQVLLTRAGIQNVMVQRAGGNTPHYWNIVNIGTGWHHFDVCPTPGNAVSIDQRFLFTESQARQYTKSINTSYLYYNYDKSTVPEVVE